MTEIAPTSLRRRTWKRASSRLSILAVKPGKNANGQAITEGRVTSTYYSPTLDRGIAMGIVHKGPERMGEVLDFVDLGGKTIRAKIVNPVFYDPEGEKQNV